LAGFESLAAETNLNVIWRLKVQGQVLPILLQGGRAKPLQLVKNFLTAREDFGAAGS